MTNSYPHKPFIGHIGDVITAFDTGVAFIIREESLTYFLVEEAAYMGADYRAIRKNRVGLVGDKSRKYLVIMCPHNQPPDRPLPESGDRER